MISILLLCCLCSCSVRYEDNAYHTAVQEVKKVVDNNAFPYKYILMYRLSSNEVGEIYTIYNGAAPFLPNELLSPVSVLVYKDKFICLIDPLASNVMSKEELQKETSYEINLGKGIDDDLNENIYHLGVSKDGRESTLISLKDVSRTSICPYVFPSLLKYMFKNYEADNIPRFIFVAYNILVDNFFHSEDNLKDHIKGLDMGEIFYFNPQDPYFIDCKKNKSKSFFATIYGNDTLKYELTDTMGHHLFVRTLDNPDFFKKLPSMNTWNHLYDLIRDSTFYFEENEGKYIINSVPYFEAQLMYNVKNDTSEVQTLYKKNVSNWFKDDSSLH